MTEEAEETIDQRVLMLDVTVREQRKRLDRLEKALAQQATATAEQIEATRALMESVKELQEMTKRHTRSVATVEAYFVEAVRLLSAGTPANELHDALREYLGEHGDEI